MKKTALVTYGLLQILFLYSCSSDKSNRFAWITDIHVSESGSGAEDLRSVTRDINRQKNIDFIIVSGDITEADFDDNLKSAKSILDNLNKPYYIIPGNHDTKWSESGGANFKKLWGEDKFVFDFSGFVFIGLHQGPVKLMADGHFAPEDLAWLDSVLVNLESKQQPIIFVTHYPIDESVDNWENFVDLIKDYNVQLIVHGHGHRNRLDNYSGIPGVMSRSSLTGRNGAGGYTIGQIDQDSIIFSERIPGNGTESVWARLLLGPVKIELNKPDYSIINEKFPNVRPKWLLETGNTIVSSMERWKDSLFFGDAGGNFYSVSLKDGKLKWQFKTHGPIFSTPSINKDRVVFSCVDSLIYCLDVKNGRLLWKHKTYAPNLASPIIDNQVVYIGGSDHSFRALELNSGEIIWNNSSIEGFVETLPLIYENLVVFGDWSETLYALDTKTGELVWSWSEGKPGVLYSPATCWPVGANGKIFIVAPDRFMTAIDVKTGSTVWRSNRFMVRETIGISEDGSKVFVQCMEDTVVAISTKSNTFTPVWIKHCGYGYDIAPSMLVEKNKVLFFGTKNGLIFALNSDTGEIKWQYKLDNTLINTVTPLSANEVLVSNMSGKVVLLTEVNLN